MAFLDDYVVAMVATICFALGYIIKHSLDFIPNRFIPLIMGVFGVALNVWLNGFQFTPEVLLGGLASGLASTGAFEMVRHLSDAEDSDKGEDIDM
jgi:hypothetical protein